MLAVRLDHLGPPSNRAALPESIRVAIDLSASGYARLGIPESQQPQGANPQNREAQLYALPYC